MLNFDEFQEYAKMKIPELIAEKGEQVDINEHIFLH